MIALREELDALALAGATWSDLLRAISRRTGSAARLLAVDGALLSQHAVPGEPSGDHEVRSFTRVRARLVAADDVTAAFDHGRPLDVELLDGSRWRALAVAAGERRVGMLLLRPTAETSRVGSAGSAGDAWAGLDGALTAASTAVGIVAVWRDARAAATAETAGWFIDELRFGGRSDAELADVGVRFGVRLAQPHVAVQLTYDGDDRRMWETALAWLATPLRSESNAAYTVVAAPAADQLAVINARLQSVLSGGTVRVAAGPPGCGAAAVRASFRLVGTIAGLAARRADEPDATAVATYENVGAAALYLHVPTAALDEFVGRHLGPLEGRDELLDTLRAWFATGGSRARVGVAVHVHRNSVGHRMQRIAELLGIDPRDPAHAESLRAALLAAEVRVARQAADVAAARVVPPAQSTVDSARGGHRDRAIRGA